VQIVKEPKHANCRYLIGACGKNACEQYNKVRQPQNKERNIEMSIRSKLSNTSSALGIMLWLFVAFFGVPILVGLGLWLIGVPLDLSSWKTYAGLMALSVAMALAS